MDGSNFKQHHTGEIPQQMLSVWMEISPKNLSEPHLISHQCFNKNPVHIVENTMVDLNVAKTLATT